MPKDWYKSKTLWINIAFFAVAVLGVLQLQPDLIPASWAPYVVAAQSILNIALRMITGTPIAGSPADTKKPQASGGGAPE